MGGPESAASSGPGCKGSKAPLGCVLTCVSLSVRCSRALSYLLNQSLQKQKDQPRRVHSHPRCQRSRRVTDGGSFSSRRSDVPARFSLQSFIPAREANLLTVLKSQRSYKKTGKGEKLFYEL